MKRVVVAAAALAVGVLRPSVVRADELVIARPRAHPDYVLAAEPHLLFTRHQAGIGVRGTLIVIDNGFVRTINNSVGLGAGVQLLNGRKRTGIGIPLYMQWNFWFSQKWSAMFEPGVYLQSNPVKTLDNFDLLLFGVGGRYLVNNGLAVEARLSSHVLSVGAALLF